VNSMPPGEDYYEHLNKVLGKISARLSRNREKQRILLRFSTDEYATSVLPKLLKIGLTPKDFIPERVFPKIPDAPIGKMIRDRVQFQQKLRKLKLLTEQGKRTKDLKQCRKLLDDVLKEEFDGDVENIDWENLANRHFHGTGCKFSAMYLKLNYKNRSNPFLNNKPWSNLEIEDLKRIANKNGRNNWLMISQKLKTKRIPLQCIRKFKEIQRKEVWLGKKRWTQKEDMALTQLVKKHGEKDWKSIGLKHSKLHLEKKRTAEQCFHRWKKTVDPTIKFGSWLFEEDMRLVLSVKFYGEKKIEWESLRSLIPGRTGMKARERYFQHVNKSKPMGWKKNQDLKMLNAVRIFGRKWTKVAREISTEKVQRTARETRLRYLKLEPEGELDTSTEESESLPKVKRERTRGINLDDGPKKKKRRYDSDSSYEP